jgi:hypothetical protein
VRIRSSADFAPCFQTWNWEDRTAYPTPASPYRPAMPGELHLDAVPVCIMGGQPATRNPASVPSPSGRKRGSGSDSSLTIATRAEVSQLIAPRISWGDSDLDAPRWRRYDHPGSGRGDRAVPAADRNPLCGQQEKVPGAARSQLLERNIRMTFAILTFPPFASSRLLRQALPPSRPPTTERPNG